MFAIDRPVELRHIQTQSEHTVPQCVNAATSFTRESHNNAVTKNTFNGKAVLEDRIVLNLQPNAMIAIFIEGVSHMPDPAHVVDGIQILLLLKPAHYNKERNNRSEQNGGQSTPLHASVSLW